MSQSILIERLALAALVTCLVSSCARNSGPHSHDEVTELKSELEQLANQVGRLEFRIYELENHHSSQPSAGNALSEPDGSYSGNNADTVAEAETNDGRYDLTPVNP
jgi:uncharacterized protein (DUF2141 family)